MSAKYIAEWATKREATLCLTRDGSYSLFWHSFNSLEDKRKPILCENILDIKNYIIEASNILGHGPLGREIKIHVVLQEDLKKWL